MSHLYVTQHNLTKKESEFVVSNFVGLVRLNNREYETSEYLAMTVKVNNPVDGEIRYTLFSSKFGCRPLFEKAKELGWEVEDWRD